MSLKEKIQSDLLAAMKARDEVKLTALRLLKNAMMKFEVSGAQKANVTDEDVLQLIKKEVKQRRESIMQFEQGGRPDLAEGEKKELAILETYLPAMMAEDDVKALVHATVAEVGANGLADMGKVMGAVMTKTQGQADGTMVRELVQAALKSL